MSELNFLELFRNINDIKHKEREGWKKHGVEGVRDTIASHSFGTAIIGWIVAEKHGRDSDRMVKMLLIHDLIMAHIPDVTPDDEEYDSKREMEMAKAEELISKMPEEIQDEFEDLFNEFQAEQTDFARIARESDKIETILQSIVYSEDLQEDIDQEFLEFYEEEFKTELGRQIYNELRQLSRNSED